YTDAPTNQRGGTKRNGVNGIDLAKEFDIFGDVKLKVNYISFVSRISLTPGSDASQINFAWFTQKGTAKKAVVELAKAAKAPSGVMPENTYSFTGVTSSGTQDFDINKASVKELTADTEYVYRVGDGTEWSPVYSFKTGNPDGAYSVIATADPQIANAKEAEAWKVTIEKAVAKAGNASFMINAGDLGDKSNSMEQYGWITAPKILRSLPFASAIGNHDTFDFLGEPHEQIGLMPLHYNWPNHTDLQVTDGDKPFIRAGGNYFFNYGKTLYIVLNSNVKDIEIHRSFMTKAVASNPNRTWTVALLHHDIYGTGDHAGTAYQDAQKMQPTWSPFLDEFAVDIAITGHDHVYARSLFMKNNEVQNHQMSAKIDPVGINIRNKNPGAYILPQGTLYMALSASACEKMYAPEHQDWVAYTHGMLGVPEYSIMTIDGESLTFTSYRSDTDESTDSITLRKKATEDDLKSLASDSQSIQFNTNIVSGWDNFQSAIEKAKIALNTKDDIHNAYVGLYEAYFAITLNTDKAKLKTLIDEVTNSLASASEGMWRGQYPEGSKAALQTITDEQTLVYTNKMSTQDETDNSTAILQSKFDAFKASVSVVDIPWTNVHSISASGVNQIELVGWMNGGMQNAYVVKQEFAKDKKGGKRSSPSDGPANGLGGRGPSDSHITKTHIGEWIRYELAVQKDGMYKAMLGAANISGKVQKILLRDTKNDTLCTFTIPSDAVLPSGGWKQAPMISADKEFYLSEGTYILELYFVNDAVGISVSSAANVAYPNDSRNVVYPDGANVDILTLERIGEVTPPPAINDPSIFVLPLPPTSIQGAPARQKGWASEGYVDDQGNVVTGISLDVFMAAKTLVLEVAAKPASTNIQLHLIPEGDTSIWAANESTPNNTPALVMDTLYQNGKLVFPLEEMLGYKEWINSKKQCMIDISYYSYGWDDMNVMKAYFIVDPVRMPKTDTAVSTTQTAVQVPSKLISREDLTKTLPLKPVEGKEFTYTVKKDETWWSIAFNYYGSMDKRVTDKIKNANKDRITDPNRSLKQGDVITLPSEGILNPVTQSSLSSMAGIYVVKAGDTLAQLANKYYGSAVLWQKIYEANKDRISIRNNIPMIYEKQWLVIPE
ncbi:MAG TPA: fibronectin type III domain-containing protein, partial [Treponemataceae bacterium]|nr:fibronectin type III domain-containing protein [Treponemataceae bacterium]